MAVYRPLCTPNNCLVASGIIDIAQASTSSCPAVSKIYATLQSVFGYSGFRDGQLKAVVAALHGHDVFVQLCTGGGKTLCMFMPPLTVSATSIGVIISPLNAIMDEQVWLFLNIIHSLGSLLDTEVEKSRDFRHSGYW